MSDAVDHPRHYNAHGSGIECIDLAEHLGFNLGNALKYLWRCEEKGAPLTDLKKAAWYLRREGEARDAWRNARVHVPGMVSGLVARFVAAEPSEFVRAAVAAIVGAAETTYASGPVWAAHGVVAAEIARREAAAQEPGR